MLDFLKNYYVFILILMVFSYLVPREEYKGYMQFFIGIFVVVLFLKPMIELLRMEAFSNAYEMFENFNARLERYELNIEEENMYEYFFYKGEGE